MKEGMKKRQFGISPVLCICLATLILFMLLALPGLSQAALGVSPGKIEINFEPNLEASYTFQAIGDDPSVELEIFTRGELGKYVSFDKKILAGGGVFTATLKLPEKIDKPGVHEIMIVVREKVNEATGIGTAIAIQAPIYIHVPYPGKYAEIALSSHNVNVGEPVNLYLTIISRGKEDINALPEIEIFSENESVEKFPLEQAVVRSQESITLKKILNTSNYRPGSYTALAVVDYEAGMVKTTAEFKIGSLFVKIINSTSRINIGGIGKFQVWVESNWNSRIDSTYASIFITKKENSIVLAGFKTPYTSLEQWGNGMLEGFFDTGNFTAGIYNANTTLFYVGNSSSSVASVEFASKESRFIIISIAVVAILIIALLIIKFMLKCQNSTRHRRRHRRMV